MLLARGVDVTENRDMARGINVYRKSDLKFIQTPPTDDVRSAEFDAWRKEADGKCLYDQPLGNESSVRLFWSYPAAEIGLPLIADMYERGFDEGIEWSDEQLEQVEQELLHLEKHWKAQNLHQELHTDLRERMQYLREAIKVARQHDGVISIT